MCSTKSWPTGCKLNSGARPPGTRSSVLDWTRQVPGGQGGARTLARPRWAAAGAAAGRQLGYFLQLNARRSCAPAIPRLGVCPETQRRRFTCACGLICMSPDKRPLNTCQQANGRGGQAVRTLRFSAHGGISQPLCSMNSQAQVIWFHLYKWKYELVYGDHKCIRGSWAQGWGGGCKGPCHSQNPGNHTVPGSAQPASTTSQPKWGKSLTSDQRALVHRPPSLAAARSGHSTKETARSRTFKFEF